MAAQDVQARLVYTVEVAEEFFLSRLHAPLVAQSAAPGQFVSLKVGQGTAPLLRVPLSIFDADARGGTVDVLFESIGPKTQALASLRPGSPVPCLGPLGNSFPDPPVESAAVLVGGGVGIPPLVFLGRRWRSAGRGGISLLAGARHRGKHLSAGLLAEAADGVRQATDDGSLGHAGLVTDLLAERLGMGDPCTVYTCGPHPMMAAVAAQCAAAKVRCYASLEEYMACGYGVCMGCVVELAGRESDDPYGRYGRVCTDGPVFEASKVMW